MFGRSFQRIVNLGQNLIQVVNLRDGLLTAVRHGAPIKLADVITQLPTCSLLSRYRGRAGCRTVARLWSMSRWRWNERLCGSHWCFSMLSMHPICLREELWIGCLPLSDLGHL